MKSSERNSQSPIRIPTTMDVRILVMVEDDGRYRMYVTGWASPDQSWWKEYQSDIECLVDLCDVFCVSPSEVAEALTADFDHLEQVLAFGGKVEPTMLRAAGFSERRQEYLN